jgi:hypothetical protein
MMIIKIKRNNYLDFKCKSKAKNRLSQEDIRHNQV